MRPGGSGRQGGLRALEPIQDTELARSQIGEGWWNCERSTLLIPRKC